MESSPHMVSLIKACSPVDVSHSPASSNVGEFVMSSNISCSLLSAPQHRMEDKRMKIARWRVVLWDIAERLGEIVIEDSCWLCE